MVRSSPVLCAVAVLLALTTGTAQVPAGRYLVTAASPAGAGGGLWTVEPLTGASQPVADPGALLQQATALGPTIDPARWLAAVDTPAGTEIVDVDLTGGQVAGAVLLAPPLAEPVLWVGHLPGSGPLALTPTSLLTFRGGQPTVLARSPSVGNRFVAAARADQQLALLLGDANATLAGIQVFDPTIGAAAVRTIAVPGATRIAWAPSLAGYFVGDRLGGIHFVDGQRYLASPIAQTPNAQPILAIARNDDQQDFLVSSGLVLLTFTGTGFVRPLALPGNQRVTAAEYQPYAPTTRRYGAPCAAAALLPRIGAVGSPHPGSRDFALVLTGAAANGTAWLLLGIAPLALPLDVAGLTGCIALVDPLDALGARTSQLGSARQQLPIPAEPGLVGGTLFLQWLALTPGANRAGALTSDALAVTF
ncbi:MAG: hypothetical protein IPM29_20240 [Planctomycetes bacterium]|nr:hypothetical protein [Planctomycetota bacterium]